jgi:aspartyl-tRNA(Asn)/glutamyl-tRNA(Gln) amidotransferase subunit A
MPTQSRVSRTGVFPVAWSLDHIGPMGRSVADVETLLSGMLEAPLTPLKRPGSIRVGVIRDFFYTRATEDARSATDGALRALESAKLEISEVHLPSIFEAGYPALMTIMRAEIASVHERLYLANPDRYGRRLRGLVETGMLLDSGAYLQALRIRRQYQKAMLECFKDVSVVITPGALGTAPEGLPTGDPVLSGVWSAADFPTLTIPVGVAGNGLPLGMQVTAPPLHETMLLDLGKVLEETIGFRAKPVL